LTQIAAKRQNAKRHNRFFCRVFRLKKKKAIAASGVPMNELPAAQLHQWVLGTTARLKKRIHGQPTIVQSKRTQ